MPTTALVIEQVLTGALALAVVILAVSRGLPALPHSDAEVTVFAAGFIGAAYLVGVLYDRVADTLLQDLDGHNRLQIGLEALCDENAIVPDDVFPESTFRVAMMGEESPAAEYANYLRSRIRILRAIATTVPALGLAYLASRASKDRPGLALLAALSVPVVYGAVFACKVAGCAGVPRTHEKDEVKQYREGRSARSGLWAFASDWPTWSGLAATTAAGAFVAGAWAPKALWIPLVSALLALLGGWCWWRVSTTYRTWLRDFSSSSGTRLRRTA